MLCARAVAQDTDTLYEIMGKQFVEVVSPDQWRYIHWSVLQRRRMPSWDQLIPAHVTGHQRAALVCAMHQDMDSVIATFKTLPPCPVDPEWLPYEQALSKRVDVKHEAR